MPPSRTGSASALLLMAHACAFAQTAAPTSEQPLQPVQPMQQVLIKAGVNDQRAQSTTTAIVINRDELLRQGDTSLADVLKRQPGITLDGAPGKPATIRMRGLGAGYAAILLNGVPAPTGFALESLSPDMIERVEIARTATAETSGQAVAGTINIILGRAGTSAGAGQDEVKIGSALSAGHAAPTFIGQHSGRCGALTYTLASTVKRVDNTFGGVNIDDGRGPDLLRRTSYTDRQIDDMLELAPRLSWQPDPLDTVSLQAYLRKRRYNGHKVEAETTEIGDPTAYPHNEGRFRAAPLQAYADLAWTRKLDAGARLSAKLSLFDTHRDADFFYRGMDLDDTLLATHHVLSGVREREVAFSGSWRRPLFDSHALAVGWEVGRKRRDEYRDEHQADALGATLLDSDEDYRASVARTAFFAQDEWDINAAWSVYLGLRREDLHTTGEGSAHTPVDVNAGVWSPIMQALFKPKPTEHGRRDEFRFAVSRTYKAPAIAQLMPRRYTVDNDNSATNPDQQGNPNLRPELSLGVDVAWERYFRKDGDKDGMVSVSAFQKRIRDVTLDRVYQNAGVWIVMPDNQGNATVRGIELEARRSRGALSLRANAARNWSHVDSVPGPDNRIAGQPAYSGNLGLDVAPSRALDVGGTYTYRSRVATRSSALLGEYDGIKRQLDLYALWKATRSGKLRISVSDLLHQDYAERTVYLGDPVGIGTLARTTQFRLRPTWRLVWEQTL